MSIEKKIKRWVVYDEEYPKGVVFEDRGDALEYSADVRREGYKAYTRLQYFTRAQLEEIPEL